MRPVILARQLGEREREKERAVWLLTKGKERVAEPQQLGKFPLDVAQTQFPEEEPSYHLPKTHHGHTIRLMLSRSKLPMS